ncbi:MAG: hypothetical protein JST35_04475 [Armatimonadetes bacterium]|jgi:hypothetical protein|nr:hypothetical protein [Armatimonadota bacterium]
MLPLWPVLCLLLFHHATPVAKGGALPDVWNTPLARKLAQGLSISDQELTVLLHALEESEAVQKATPQTSTDLEPRSVILPVREVRFRTLSLAASARFRDGPLS